MLVICYGITKSGSTLAFELAKQALAHCGHPQDRLSDEVVTPGHKINFVDSMSAARIEKLEHEIGPDRIIAVKTHAGLDREKFQYVDRLCADGRLKVQIVYRDPRDVCLSMVDAGRKARAQGHGAFSEIHDISDAIHSVEKQLAKLRRWGALSNVLRISYDKAAFETDAALSAIDAHLGLASNHAAVIDEVMNRAFTQKNKGVRGRHRNELNEPDRKVMAIVFGAFLKQVLAEDDFSWFTDARRSLLQGAAARTDS